MMSENVGDSGRGRGGSDGSASPAGLARIELDDAAPRAEAESAERTRALQLMDEEKEGVEKELLQMVEDITAVVVRQHRERGTHREAMEKLEKHRQEQVRAEGVCECEDLVARVFGIWCCPHRAGTSISLADASLSPRPNSIFSGYSDVRFRHNK